MLPSRLLSKRPRASRPLAAVRRPSLLPKYSDNSSLMLVIWPSPLRSTTIRASWLAAAPVLSQAVGNGNPNPSMSKLVVLF